MVAEVAQPDVLTRDRVALEETWDLSTIYLDESGWETDAARLPEALNAATGHRGHFGESAERLARALDDVMAVRQMVERLRVYAQLRRDEDTGDSDAMARY